MEKVLVAAQGPNSLKYKAPLMKLVGKNGLTLIESNHTGHFDDVESKIMAILNETRLSRFLRTHADVPAGTTVVTGVGALPQSRLAGHLCHFPCELGDLAVAGGKVRIPDYDAGMYAVALALASGAKELYLTGFDGFEDAEKNIRMEGFFKAVAELCAGLGARIVAVTPTRYRTLAQTSVYGWLQS
jgi:hypothetical protein